MVTLSPTHPERTEAIRLWYAVRETLSPTRPERAEAHSPGHRPGLFGAVTSPCKGKSFKTPGNI